MNILFLTDNFPPEGNAPATRTYEHAKEWVKHGHKVTVITCAPNFPDGVVFEGYRNAWYQKAEMDGIEVIRVKTYITANEGFIRRILDYLSFMVSGTVAGLFQKKVDIVVATSPQFFTAVGGWLVSGIKRKPFVFELRDIWPASITAVGAMKQSFSIRLLEKLELFLYRKADHIVSVTNSFKQELVARGVDGAKISVVLNGVDADKYLPASEKAKDLAYQLGIRDKFVVGYVGTHGMAHALETLVDAAELLQEKDEIRFLFAGGGAAKEKLERYVAEKKLNNVLILGRQPKEMMPNIWSLCDVSVAHLKNTALFSTVIPSKIFESMAMGLPILMAVPKGEATEIIEENDCGIVVEPENAQAIADAVIRLASDKGSYQRMSENSLKAAPKFARKRLALEMLTTLETISNKPS